MSGCYLGLWSRAGISQLTQLRPRDVGKAESMQPQVMFVHLKFYRVSVKSGNIDNVLFFLQIESAFGHKMCICPHFKSLWLDEGDQ